MSKQPAAAVVAQLKLAGAEDDVPADRVGASTHGTGGFGGAVIGMDTYLGKVVAEAGFEEAARSKVERMAGRAEDFVYERRSRPAFKRGLAGKRLTGKRGA